MCVNYTIVVIDNIIFCILQRWDLEKAYSTNATEVTEISLMADLKRLLGEIWWKKLDEKKIQECFKKLEVKILNNLYIKNTMTRNVIRESKNQFRLANAEIFEWKSFGIGYEMLWDETELKEYWKVYFRDLYGHDRDT